MGCWLGFAGLVCRCSGGGRFRGRPGYGLDVFYVSFLRCLVMVMATYQGVLGWLRAEWLAHFGD